MYICDDVQLFLFFVYFIWFSFPPIKVHFKVLKHKKGQLVEEVKKYIAYVLDCHQKAAPGERMVLIFDFKGAGVTNMVSGTFR